MNIKDWMELVGYKITEGSNYYFQPYGTNAYALSYWNENHDGHSVGIVFDTKTQEVFCVEACDYKNDRAYRYINPAYNKFKHDSYAWDNVKWTDLEVYEDFLEKSKAIIADIDYDTRIQVPVDISDEEFVLLAKMAHDRDITINKMVEEILQKVIDEHQANA